MIEDEVNEALQNFSNMLSEKHPEVGDILAKVRAGELEETEAMRLLMAKVQLELDLASDVESLASEAFFPLQRGEGAITTDGDTPPLVVVNEKGVQSLNPLVEAALAERVQFDGDAPEMRHGPLPEGVRPAVPVSTKTRNAVALGLMLEKASEEVAHEIHQKVEGHIKLLEGSGTALKSLEDLPLMPTGVEGYEAGKVPALREVENPSGSVLALLSDDQRQQSTWRVLSTTQGRRSALSGIEEMLLVGLAEEGFDIPSRPPGVVKDAPLYAEWSLTLSGQGEVQSNFNYLGVAARSLLRQLTEQVRDRGLPSDPFLEVKAVNTVDIRRVGWEARIVSGSAS